MAREFARSVVRRKWDDIPVLLIGALRERVSPSSLAGEFGRDALVPRLRQMHADRTGEEPDPEDPLDPPRRFEVSGLDPSVPVGWVEVGFLLAEDSAFDQCYNCFLAVVGEDEPRVTAYVIESATE